MLEKFKEVFNRLRLTSCCPLPKILFSAVCFLLAAFVLGSCGYHLGEGRSTQEHMTISVPYVEGDRDGMLTTAIVKQISQTGVFTYHQTDARYLLRVKIIEFRDDNIGFRYDRNKHERLIKSLIPAETRLKMVTEVVLLDSYTDQYVLGPVQIVATADFDHEDYTSRRGINIFSLGQLSDVDDAQDVAMTPLNRRMARKIVDFVVQNDI